MTLDQDAPIGVFDSGLGGLTVVSQILRTLPGEKLVYLGDTARVPYGTRTAATVVRYARSCARALAEHDIKTLVVACNTVSAVALPALRVELDLPVVGVIEPGASAGVGASRTGRIGVLATPGTIASGAYERAVSALDSRVEVFPRAAPLLVPLVEEGWTHGDVPRLVARRYVEQFAGCDVDAIVLGCTHYPLLRDIIEEEARRVCGSGVAVVDGSQATAQKLAEELASRDLCRSGEGSLDMLVTDLPGRFAESASRFLGRDASDFDVQLVDL